MTKFRGLVASTVVLVTISTAGFIGCSNKPSDEEMQQLENLRQEVSSLEQEVKALKDERTKLERQIGENNAKLEQCAKDKEATKRNLENLPK